MEYKTLILADASATESSRIDDLRELCRSYAAYFNEPIGLAVLESADLEKLNTQALVAVKEGIEYVKPIPPAPMTAADFLYNDDGSANWGEMWQSFCDLALYGGPPHRGEDSALTLPELDFDTPPTDGDMIREIKRGIWETTGLFAEPSSNNWMAITCSSRKMAAWMCAAIILENVDARCDEERLYVPAAPDFELKNQVKSVITVVAKVHHYWQAHIAQQEAAAATAV